MSLLARAESLFDRIVGGRGEFSITVPVMDGPLKPNDLLERGRHIHGEDRVDTILRVGNELLVSAHEKVLSLDPTGSRPPAIRYQAESEISCLAVSGGGALAIGIDGAGIRISGGRHDGSLIQRGAQGSLNCPTAAVFLDEDTIVVANGSASYPAASWRHDWMALGGSGVVTRIDLASGKARDLAAGLRFPSGLCLESGDANRLFVAEAWRHRVIAIDLKDGVSLRPVLSNLPAYPGRILASSHGGYWLVCFAARSQLQEFVLREDRFRRRMMEEVDPRFWIAPDLASGKSFKEPLQAGGVIRLGVHKPWAPTRSYGLVVRLDQDFQPVWSAHSRADGKRHGVTAAAEFEDKLFVVSKGRGEIFTIGHTGIGEPADLNAARGEPA